MDWTVVVTTLGPLTDVGLGVLLNSRSARRQATSAYRRETLQKIYTEYMASFYDYQLIVGEEVGFHDRGGEINIPCIERAAEKLSDPSMRTQGLTLIYDDDVPDYIQGLGTTLRSMRMVLIKPEGFNRWDYSNYVPVLEEQGTELATQMRISLNLDRMPSSRGRLQEWRLERKYPSKIKIG